MEPFEEPSRLARALIVLGIIVIALLAPPIVLAVRLFDWADLQ